MNLIRAAWWATLEIVFFFFLCTLTYFFFIPVLCIFGWIETFNYNLRDSSATQNGSKY